MSASSHKQPLNIISGESRRSFVQENNNEKKFSDYLFSALVTFLTSCAPGKSDGLATASQEASKELVRHWISSMWDKGDREVFEELATDDYVYSAPGQEYLIGDAAFGYGGAILPAIPYHRHLRISNISSRSPFHKQHLFLYS
jgi:hypothetical protein